MRKNFPPDRITVTLPLLPLAKTSISILFLQYEIAIIQFSVEAHIFIFVFGYRYELYRVFGAVLANNRIARVDFAPVAVNKNLLRKCERINGAPSTFLAP